MAVKHLTDGEIQALVEENVSKGTARMRAHVERCAACNMKVRQYERLFTALSCEDDFALPHGFAQSVMAKIQPERSLRVASHFWYVAAGILFLAVGLGTTFYFIGTAALLEGVSVTLSGSKSLGAQLFQVLKKYLAGVDLDIGLLGFAILILIIISTLDHFILQPKRKTISFFR